MVAQPRAKTKTKHLLLLLGEIRSKLVGCIKPGYITIGSSPSHMHPVNVEMKGNKKRRVVMRRQQSLVVRAKRIILPIIALGIFVLLTRTIGSAPRDDKGRQFVHLRGGNNKNLVWVHSDSQPFVSGTLV